jgi:hypothetical protein
VTRFAVLSNTPVMSESADNDCYLGAGTFVPHTLTHTRTRTPGDERPKSTNCYICSTASGMDKNKHCDKTYTSVCVVGKRVLCTVGLSGRVL